MYILIKSLLPKHEPRSTETHILAREHWVGLLDVALKVFLHLWRISLRAGVPRRRLKTDVLSFLQAYERCRQRMHENTVLGHGDRLIRLMDHDEMTCGQYDGQTFQVIKSLQCFDCNSCRCFNVNTCSICSCWAHLLRPPLGGSHLHRLPGATWVHSEAFQTAWPLVECRNRRRSMFRKSGKDSRENPHKL